MYADDGGNRPVELTEVNTHTMKQVVKTTKADLEKEAKEKRDAEIAQAYEDYYRNSLNVPADGTYNNTPSEANVKTPEQTLEDVIGNCSFDQINAMIYDDMDFSIYSIAELQSLYDRIDALDVGKKAFDNVNNKNKFMRQLKKYIKDNTPKEENEQKWWRSDTFANVMSVVTTVGIAIGMTALVIGSGGTATPLVVAMIGAMSMSSGVVVRNIIDEDDDENAFVETLGGAAQGAIMGYGGAIAQATYAGGMALWQATAGMFTVGTGASATNQLISTGEVDWGQAAIQGTVSAITFAGINLLANGVTNTSNNTQSNNATNQSVNDKLNRYLLNKEHPVGGSKANWFEQALGFTKENMDDLACQITFDPNKAVMTEITQYGTKYNQTIPITGANGRTIDVTFAWMKSVDDDVVRLITAIPTK